MNLKDKIKWRVDFFKKIIQRGRFETSDLFDFFLPNGKLKKRKIKEELESLFNVRIKSWETSPGFHAFNFSGYQIITPFSMQDKVIGFILDFGIQLLNRKTDINEIWKESIFLEREGPYELGNCYLEGEDVVIDAGANIGIFSLFASKIIGEKGEIFAFEPVKKTKEICEKNMKNNNIKNCRVFQCALGDCNRRVEIFVDDNNLTSASMVKKEEAKRKEDVEQVKLDDFIAQNNIKKVDFIKADIEGAERYFLEGAKETIRKFKPKIAICTYHLENDPEIIENFLKELVREYNITHKYKKLYAYV